MAYSRHNRVVAKRRGVVGRGGGVLMSCMAVVIWPWGRYSRKGTVVVLVVVAIYSSVNGRRAHWW